MGYYYITQAKNLKLVFHRSVFSNVIKSQNQTKKQRNESKGSLEQKINKSYSNNSKSHLANSNIPTCYFMIHN